MIERVSGLDTRQVERVLALLADEEARSGRRPLDEVNRLALTGVEGACDACEHWLAQSPDGLLGYAVVNSSDIAEIAATDQEAAEQLLTAVAAAHPKAQLWTHGDHSMGRSAASALGWQPDRELVLLARPLPLDRPERPLPDHFTRMAFDSQRDTDDWLALNRLAFADLPDQADWTAADLQLRLAAPWFDADDFHIARAPDGTLAGFHWTKIDPDAAVGDEVSGEVFVIATDPRWRGTGLGGALLDHGLVHLAERGMRQVHLFADADNSAAIALYERAGFRRIDGDRLFRRPASP